MKKLSEYLLLWTMGGAIYYTFELVFPRIFPLVHVCAGRVLPGVLCPAGEMDALGVRRSGSRWDGA